MSKEIEGSKKSYETYRDRAHSIQDEWQKLNDKMNNEIIESEEYQAYQVAINVPGISEESKEYIKSTQYNPEWGEIETRIQELDDEHKKCIDVLKSMAKQLDTHIQETIARVNKSITFNENKITELNTLIDERKKTLESIKETEEYQKGDEETLLKASSLEREIKALKGDLGDRNKLTKKYKQEIVNCENQREAIIEELSKFGIDDIIKEDINPKDASEEKGVEESKDGEESKKDVPEEKDKKKRVNQSRGGSDPVILTYDTELSEEEKAKKEQAEQEKKFKEDFEALCKKVKKGKLEPEEFEKMLAIMGDKENYDKLGITTGVVFNKAKNIFDSLRKSAKKDAEKMGRIEETFATYQEVFVERNGKKKVDTWYKFFDKVGGIERKQYQKGLPAPRMESTKPEKSKSPIEKDLEGKRNEPGEENKIPLRKPQTKEEKTI